MAENQYVNKVTYGTNEDGTENVLIDISDSTLDQYKIYDGEIGYGADGGKITGMLNTWSGVYSRTSAHELVVYCPFEPKVVNVHLFGNPTTSNTVINIMAWKINGFRSYESATPSSIAYYLGHSVGSKSGSNYSMVTHQFDISASTQQRFTYDAVNKQAHIRTPDDSTYSFDTTINYRIMLAR